MTEQPTTGGLLYLEDLRPGQVFTTQSYRVESPEMLAFARQYDPQPFHLDDEAARATLFGGLAGSGWLTAAISIRLQLQSGAPIAGGLIGAGGQIAWPRPVRPGDVLSVHSEVLEVRPSVSKPDRGIVTVRNETRNQNGETVQVFTVKLVVPRRPTQG